MCFAPLSCTKNRGRRKLTETLQSEFLQFQFTLRPRYPVDRITKTPQAGLTLFGQTRYLVFYGVSLSCQRGWLVNEFDLLSVSRIM